MTGTIKIIHSSNTNGACFFQRSTYALNNIFIISRRYDAMHKVRGIITQDTCWFLSACLTNDFTACDFFSAGVDARSRHCQRIGQGHVAIVTAEVNRPIR